jgi:hypothetical protein
MEAVDVNKDVDKVLRLIEKKRESVLVLKDGRPHCMMLPVGSVEGEAAVIPAARAKRARKGSGQAPLG